MEWWSGIHYLPSIERSDPKASGIGGGTSCRTVGHIRSPPSLSKTLILETTSGGPVGIGCVGGVEVIGAEDGMGGEKQKSTLSPHIWKDMVLAYMLIFAPTVARNGLPRMIGT